MKKFLLVSTMAAALGLSAVAAPFVVDTAQSKVGFSIKHLKLTQVDGVFEKYDATIDYDTANKSLSVFEGSVSIDSVNTQNTKRDEHLRANDIFDAKKYPQMSFKMTSYAPGKITGDLTIKGVTKSIILDSKEALDGGILSIDAMAPIKRSDFGVVWEKSLQDSLVSDELTIHLHLKASAK
ncbi:MAG: YceI family protein [Helicobacteraceae bacterium]|nr:YceI family protein [Helicobacteraceae bacterium]